MPKVKLEGYSKQVGYIPIDRNDVPSTREIPQPRWDERYGLHKTRKLSKICRLGNKLQSTAFKCWLQQFKQTKRFENQYALSVAFGINQRTTFALVGRHAGAVDGDNSALTNLPNLGIFPVNNADSPLPIEARNDGLWNLWANYNAAFYEAQSVNMANGQPGTTYFPNITNTVGATGTNFYNNNDLTVLSDSAAVAAYKPIPPHGVINSPLTDLTESMKKNYQWIGNGSLMQRHESGGMKVNITNSSDYPMCCDIIVFKCKKNPKGDDLGGGTALLSVDGATLPFDATTTGNYTVGDQLSPAQNIFSCHDKRFENWKKQGNNNNQVDQNGFDASNDFLSSPNNVNTMPTWKLLSKYAGSQDVLKGKQTNTDPNAIEDWYVGMDNYKEIERTRVAIPLSGTYVHTIEYGGMEYNIADRVNRAQNQGRFLVDGAASKSFMKINDIGGETICVVVSVVGQQLPGEIPGTIPGLHTMATAAGTVNVRVSEYEVIHPFYTSPVDSITQSAGQYWKLHQDAIVRDIVPMTQWNKTV